MDRFRILSLDGGGIQATFTASVLADYEQRTGKRIADHFDLITGASSGGWIALGLGLGLSAEEILRFHVARGAEIFSTGGSGRVINGTRHAFRPDYSRDDLVRSLAGFFGDRLLGESRCRLVIPSFDCHAGRIQLFKTAHHERLVQDYRVPVREVALAAAATPTHFPALGAPGGQTFLDGGAWAGCPVVVGLHEAIHVLERDPASIDILSLGSTDASFEVPEDHEKVSLLMRGQVEGALARVGTITGRPVLRIDTATGEGRSSRAVRVEDLRALATRRAKETHREVSRRFLDTPAEPFVSFHSLPSPKELEERGKQQVARRRRRRSLGIARTGFPRMRYPIADLSVSGALLETSGMLPIGDTLDLDLLLENGEVAHVCARVARIQHPRWGVPAGVGIQFTELPGHARSVIEKYVEESLSEDLLVFDG